MAANSLQNARLFARLTLMNLGTALNVAKNMSKAVSGEFGKGKSNGFKPGNSIDVPKPYRFVASTSRGDLSYAPQAVIDQYTRVKVDRLGKVHWEFDSIEKALSVRELDKLYAKPAANALAASINAEAAQFVAENTFHSVGTPGTIPNAVLTYLNAGDKLVQSGLPENEPLTCIIDRKMSSAYVAGVSTLYNPAGSIGSQYTLGEIAEKSLGYTFKRDETLFKRTVGTYAGAPLINGANQTGTDGDNGTMTLAIDGWTSGSTTLKPGDRFTLGGLSDAVIGGVLRVHPQTKQSTGEQQQFVVLSQVSDSTGAMAAVTVAPAITISGPYQNCNIAPVDNAIVTMVGTSAKVTRQGILMHENAYAFVSVPLANPEEGDGVKVFEETDPETGLSLSYIKAFDPVRRVFVNRFDVLYDFAPLYREMACIIES